MISTLNSQGNGFGSSYKELIAEFLLGENESFSVAQSFSKLVHDYKGIKGHDVLGLLSRTAL